MTSLSKAPPVSVLLPVRDGSAHLEEAIGSLERQSFGDFEAVKGIDVDVRTGELSWESRLADYRDGITHSSGAMIIDGRVMSGRTCGDSARCFIAAHDAAPEPTPAN